MNDQPIYFRNSSESQMAVLAIHEHLGLVQNFTNTIQDLVVGFDNVAVMIPDCFWAVQEKEDGEMRASFILFRKLNSVISTPSLINAYNT